MEKATFAGGCFWCTESLFDNLEGVKQVAVGYTGGKKANPTYEEVSSGKTGHCEAVEVIFDPKVISYEKLLDIFWRNIDPTTLNAQFADQGTQYRTAIFYHTPEQKRLAEASKKKWDQSGSFAKPIVTEITAASVFYPAEDYHQEYHKKNPVQYNLYRFGSGREQYLDSQWGKDRSH